MTIRLADDPNLAFLFSGGGVCFEGSFRHIVGLGSCGFHRHSAFEIVLHATGRGRVALATGQEAPFEPGTIVLHPPEIPHDQNLATRGEYICLLIGLPTDIVSLPALRRLHCSADYLRHEFKKRYGTAVKRRLTQVRDAEHSARLILDSISATVLSC